jgi:hypothetical protein
MTQSVSLAIAGRSILNLTPSPVLEPSQSAGNVPKGHRPLVGCRRMKRLALAWCVVALLLCGAGPASAETVPLGSKQDTSRWPSVFILSEDLERAESFVVTVTAEPVQAVQFSYHVSCARGSDAIRVESPEATVTPPFTTTILPTLPEPDRCWIDASAEASLEDGVPGTVKIEVIGNRRPAPPPVPVVSPSPNPTAPPTPVTATPAPTWKTCAKPSFLRSGRTEALGVACEKSRRVVTAAWRKPAKVGHSVRALGFSCRRTNHGRSAKVHCVKGTAIARATGVLPIVFRSPRQDAR